MLFKNEKIIPIDKQDAIEYDKCHHELKYYKHYWNYTKDSYYLDLFI